MPDAVVPLVLQPSFSWSGNDGNWSTFLVNIGTPAQQFHVLPSTVGDETWIPVAEGCSPYTFTNCGLSRGALPVSGAQSNGFQQNESTSWQEVGIYTLGLEDSLYGNEDSGLYGSDTMSLGSSNATFTQTIAGIATSNFWLGVLGLGVVPAAFDVRAQNVESLLTTLVNQSLIPSQSYGYSAGAAYRSAAGGVVLGGYDQDAFTPSDVDFDLYFSGARSLTVSLRSVVASNTLQGTIALPAGPYNMSIDSTISQLWLPRALCDALQESLGLTYDESTDLYLINATARERLLSLSPEFTFTLAPSATTNVTATIELPFAAFDQEIGVPILENRTRYFPIKRAANESQFVLGRAFLQEAYLVTDWTRQRFTLGQSLHHNGVSNNIVPILPEAPATGLSVGAIAGIAVGAAVAIVMCCVLAWWVWRRRRQGQVKASKTSNEHGGLSEHCPEDKKQMEEVDGVLELAYPVRKPDAELVATERYELHEDQMQHQLMSQPVYELPGHSAEHELDARERGALLRPV